MTARQNMPATKNKTSSARASSSKVASTVSSSEGKDLYVRETSRRV